MSEGFAGNVAPAAAWEILKSNPSAVLVDVRTEPEWLFVGVPDLSPLGRPLIRVAWQVYPSMERNPRFEEELRAQGLTPEHQVLLICRSGVRSKAAAILLTGRGFPACWNISDGFEGQIDERKHRGNGGWRASGLPWTQG